MKEMLENFLKNAGEEAPPLDQESFYAHGYALYHSGNVKDAIEVFKVLCARDPLEERFWFALGACLQENKEYFEALHAWAMVATLNRTNPYPHFHAAECAFSMNQMGDAHKALSEAKMRFGIEDEHPLKNAIAFLEERWRTIT